MTSQREAILARVGPFFPEDKRRDLLAQLDLALVLMERHGDQEALPNLATQVEAICQAVEAGDVEAAVELGSQWGLTAGMVELLMPPKPPKQAQRPPTRPRR